MKTVQDLKNEAEALLRKAKKQAELEALDQINIDLKKFQNELAEKQWIADTKAFSDYEKAKSLVVAKRNAVEAAGVIAVDDTLKTSSAIDLRPDNTAFTFDSLPIGRLIHIKESPWLVTGGTISPVGSVYTLLPARTKAWLLKSDEKINPYNFTESHFNRLTKQLTVARTSPVNPSKTIVIDGIRYSAIAQIGSQKNVLRYELSEVAD